MRWVGVESADYHVYVLTIVAEGQMFLYVGETADVERRMKDHDNDKQISVPVEGEMKSTEYDLIAVNKVIPVHGSKAESKYVEREVFLDLLDSCSRELVIGGR
jgi:uncharacterized protein (UPF0335 family)